MHVVGSVRLGLVQIEGELVGASTDSTAVLRAGRLLLVFSSDADSLLLLCGAAAFLSFVYVGRVFRRVGAAYHLLAGLRDNSQAIASLLTPTLVTERRRGLNRGTRHAKGQLFGEEKILACA